MATDPVRVPTYCHSAHRTMKRRQVLRRGLCIAGITPHPDAFAELTTPRGIRPSFAYGLEETLGDPATRRQRHRSTPVAGHGRLKITGSFGREQGPGPCPPASTRRYTVCAAPKGANVPGIGLDLLERSLRSDDPRFRPRRSRGAFAALRRVSDPRQS